MATATLAGCSMTMTLQRFPHPAAPPEPTAHATPDASDATPPQAVDEAPKPPTINVFGEFNGKPGGPLKQATAPTYRRHTFGDTGGEADVSLDPTGQWMVYSSTRDGEHAAIYLQRTDSPSVTQMTNGVADDTQPVFSPDGKRIAFSSNRTGKWHLFVMDVDGRKLIQLTDGASQDLHPSFSPDSQKLVYCTRSDNGGSWELWTLDLQDKARRMIGPGLFPSWSPEKGSDRIAFQKTRARGSRWFSLWTLDLVDGEARRVTEVAVSANAALVTPAWSPDGQAMVFATIVEPAVTHAGKPTGQEDVWMVNADGTDRHRLTDGAGANLNPCWGVDNRVYFISDRGGHESIWSVSTGWNAATHEMTQDAQANRPQQVGATDSHNLAQ